MRETTRMRVETEMIMPRSMRKERSLWARMVSSATPIGSRRGKPWGMQRCPYVISTHERGGSFKGEGGLLESRRRRGEEGKGPIQENGVPGKPKITVRSDCARGRRNP